MSFFQSPVSQSPFRVQIFTLFPELFPGILGASVTGRALKKNIWSLRTVNIREFAHGKHAEVDDTPYGGGAGMVMRADVIDRALKSQLDSPEMLSGKMLSGCDENHGGHSQDSPQEFPRDSMPLLYVSPRGKPFTQDMARDFSHKKGLSILCGRFEGVDQRVLDTWNIQEVSLGDFVLSGGEIAAQAIIDATLRLIPGVLGANASLSEESFSSGLLEYPHYTKPREWNDCNVPEVLLSGNHKDIETWRQKQSEIITRERRPDLWEAYLRNRCVD